MGFYQLLGLPRGIEKMIPGFMHKRVCLVRGHHEMGAAEVFLDNGLEHRLFGACLSGRKGQKPQHDHGFGKLLHKGFVAVHRGEMIQIPRGGNACHGLEKDVCPGIPGRLDYHLFMGTMEEFFRVKPDDVAPTVLGEAAMGFRGGFSKIHEIKVQGVVKAFNGAANVPGVGFVKEIKHRRVEMSVLRAVGGLGLQAFVGFPDVFDV